MKKIFGFILLVAVGITISFTSCQKGDKTLTKDGISDSELSLKSLEPDVMVRGTGEKEDYEKVIVEELFKKKECKWEIVSGIMEFYYDGEMVFAVDFGDGNCDGVATVSWLDDENILQSQVVNVWKLFKKPDNGDKRKKCFEFVFPVSYTMPDGSSITIESKEDWSLLREWYENNPAYEEKPALNFPVDIEYRDGNTSTINTIEELREARMDCKKDHVRKCFELVLPVSMTMPDGTTITVETEDDWALVKEWHLNNPEVEERGSLVYPVDIVYEDGTTFTINNEEEMRRAKIDCKDGQDKKCFEYTLPVSFTMPNEAIITIATKEDWSLIKEWYTENPGYEEKPSLNFPVEITFKDGTTLTVNNEEEMMEVHRDCHDHGHGK